jgi:trehalose/maltose transport system permease protein
MTAISRPGPLSATKRKSNSLRRSQTRLAWLMLAPALLGIVLVALYPFARTVYQSFTDAQFIAPTPAKWIGFKNYSNLWHDTTWWSADKVTVRFAFYTIPIEFVLGVAVALVVNSQFRGRGVMRASMLIPWAIPTVVAAQMWKWMYDQVFGVINALFQDVGIISHPLAWTSLPSTSLPAIAAVDVWKTTPFVALLLLAGLQVIPSDVYEAARIDGASAWQQFWRITWPLLRPAILVVLIFRTLDVLRVFDVFYVFYGNRLDTETMAIYVQNTIVGSGQVGYGAAMSVGMFVIIGIFVVIYLTAIRTRDD